jgi:hypothetical protein
MRVRTFLVAGAATLALLVSGIIVGKSMTAGPAAATTNPVTASPAATATSTIPVTPGTDAATATIQASENPATDAATPTRPPEGDTATTTRVSEGLADTTARVSTKTLLGQLAVQAKHPAGYRRADFPTWTTTTNGCNTREAVLIAEATKKPTIGAGCRLTGGAWASPYDGVSVTDPSKLDIDHLVPLEDAWQSGAWRWSLATRTAYANDLGYSADLIAVTAHANRSKGDREPPDWLPEKASFRCAYEADWVAVEWRWHLSVSTTEKTWLASHLAACHWPSVPRPSRPVIHTTAVVSAPTSSRTSSSASGATLTSIYFDSPGSDTGSRASLDAEAVTIKNTTKTTRVLTGWTLHDASHHTYVFGPFSLRAGRSVTIHTGQGTNTAADRYWGRSGRVGYIWNNTGDTATLVNAAGRTVDTCRYTARVAPKATC